MIIFFGPPGSGKSVQGQLLVGANGWKWLSTGELFRATTDAEIKARMASGELISDDMTNRLVEQALAVLPADAQVVLDGYPRNPVQAQWLLDNLAAHNQEIAAVVVFDTPGDELVRRQLGRGRADDTEEVIRRRLEIYEENTRPLIELYRGRGVPVINVDGLGTVDEVHARLQEGVRGLGLTSVGA